MHANKYEGGFMAIGVIAVVVVGSIIAGIIIASDKEESVMSDGPLEEQMEVKMMDDAINDDHMEGDGDMKEEMMDDGMNADESSMEDGMMDDETVADVMQKEPIATEVSMTPGTYGPYSADKLALAADGDVVLFFHASWCPSCRALESDIKVNIASIPANTHILVVDYDNSTELKKKYGVVRQHTLVQVDQNGVALQTLTGLTNTLAQVSAQL